MGTALLYPVTLSLCQVCSSIGLQVHTQVGITPSIYRPGDTTLLPKGCGVAVWSTFVMAYDPLNESANIVVEAGSPFSANNFCFKKEVRL